MRSRFLLAALAVLVGATAPTAFADGGLRLTHISVDAHEEAGDGDDVVTPGDRIHLEHVFRSDTAITGVSGELTSVTPDVGIEEGSSAYDNVPAGGEARNRRTYEALLPQSMTCGTNVEFTVSVEAAEETGDVSFSVPTGGRGPLKPYLFDPSDPVSIADSLAPLDPPTLVQIIVPSAGDGLVKEVQVQVPALTHGRVGDLVLTLVAPDGTEVTLMDRRGGDGDDLTGTVFADDGSPIGGASAPFTGTYAPEEPLAVLEGRRLNGTWGLRVEDRAAGETGTLDGFELDARRAHCQGLPTAVLKATPEQVEPGGIVSFDATQSRDDLGGGITRYEFDLDGNGSYEISSASDATHTHTYTTRGTYKARVRVTDSDGLTDVDIVTIPVTERPVAALSISDTAPLSLTDVTLDATDSTDGDGDIARHQWDLDGDGAFESDSQRNPQLTAQFPRPGSFDVGVRVTDDNGAYDEATVRVDVQNRAPVAGLAVPALVVVGRAALLTAEASDDPDGTIVAYEWDLDGVGGYEHDSGGAPTVDRTFETGGAKTIGVRVTDDSGATHTASVSVVARHAPAVALSTTANPVSLRRPATLDPAGTTDQDTPSDQLTYMWELDGDGDFDDAAGPAPRTVAFPTGRTVRIGVRVSDPHGATTDRTIDLVVRNVLPTARVTAAPARVVVGEQVALDATTSSDPDGSVVAYAWDLDDDGSFETDTGPLGQAATSFPNPGWLNVRVRVTDDDGGHGVELITIGVVAAPTGDGGGTPPPAGSGGGGPTAGGGGAAGGAGGGPGPAADAPGDAAPVEPAGAPSAPTGAPAFTASLTGPAIQRTTRALRRGFASACTASDRGRCVVEAFLSRRDAIRLGLAPRGSNGGPVKLGRRSARVEGGRTYAMSVKPSKRATVALRGRRNVSVLLRGFARDWFGHRVELTRVILLRG